MESERYKELKAKLATLQDEKAKIDVMVDIGVEVRNFDVEEASRIADEILERANAISYTAGKGRAMNLKGSCYWQRGEYEEGIEILKQAQSISVKIMDRRLEARVLYHLGNIYRDQGDLGNALSYFERALNIHEELDDDVAQSIVLTSLSNLLYDLSDFDSALEYALKSLPILERANGHNSLTNIRNTLGNIYFKKENYDEALKYFQENFANTDLDSIAYIMAESGLGKVYYKMGNFDYARSYLTHALKRAQQVNNIEIQIICQFYVGRLYMDEDSYRQSLQSLTAAFNLAVEYNRRHDLVSIHEAMSLLYDKMGDIPRAFHHLKSFELLKDEIFKQKYINEVRNLQVKQQIELARKEKEVAERTAQLKHQFLANMSHEIRTPMNAIVGMTRLLQGRGPKPDQLRYLNAIQQSANNLLVIINDILDVSKIEAGKIVIEEIDFTINEVLQSVKDMLLLKAEEKQLELRITADPLIPKRLVGDPTRLNQILINLAGNAVKFTDKGYVEVKTTLQKKEDKLWVKFDVIDTGIGISADYVDSIFDSFTQAGADVTRKFGGTGLGLTICKQLVHLMGGDISVKSTLGEGTVFTCVIPFAEASIQEDAVKEIALDHNAIDRLNKASVLLVEDNDFNRMVALDTLNELLPAMHIDYAVNGQDAIEKLQKDSYDLILMDIQMPVMDGVTATKQIRNFLTAPLNSIKIIAMTANVMQEDVQLYLATGMDAYVSKPFNTEELLLKMHKVLDGVVLHERHSKVVEQTVTTTESKPQVPETANTTTSEWLEDVTNMEFLKQFTGARPEKMQKYINMFLENAPKLMTSLTQGLEKKDYAAVKIAAHSLKPQLSYMGVKEEMSHILLIEQSAGSSAHYERIPALVEQLKLVCEKAYAELKTK